MRLLFLVTLAVVAMVPAKAAVLYSSLGPGNSYSTLKYGLDGAMRGFSFQVGAPGAVDTISLALSHQAPAVTAVVSLYAGTASTLDTLLESYSLPVTSSSASLLTVNSTLHPLLQPGSTYWLMVRDPGSADGDSLEWYFTGQNSASFFGPIMGDSGQLGTSGWYAAFQVNSAATPEPAVSGLVLCGLLAMGAARFRRHR